MTEPGKGARRLSFTAGQARLLHLVAQGLEGRSLPSGRATRDDVRAAVAQMGVLQLDTINVVARSPYLVLFSRLGEYRAEWLDELVASGALFEVWSHEACIAPIEDYGVHRRSLETRNHWFMNRARRLVKEQGGAMRELLEHIRRTGPVKASDFASPRKDPPGWWAWKKEKAWLEAWLALGELMVARRERFQRVYDLTSRVHPGATSQAQPSHEATAMMLAERAVRALGVTQARWIHDYFRTRPRLTEEDLRPLVEAGSVTQVEVKGWAAPGYLHRDHLPVARQVLSGEVRAMSTTLLSPFDPVVWDRERARVMFGFDYRLECYVPARKRRFGYFVLPILRRGALVGRLDAKAHRSQGRFEVKALHLETGTRTSGALLDDLARALRACARWHGTPDVEVQRSVPAAVRRPLAARL